MCRNYPSMAGWLAVCWLLGSASAWAQEQATGGGPFYDSVDINVATIEVMVTDEDGLPVKGLTREDFELLENGRPVAITNFFAVEDQRAVLEDEETGEVLAEDAPGPEPETRQLSLVIFVDNDNISPRTRNQIFANLRHYLAEGLAPDDRVMVVKLSGQVEVVQEFTSDAELLATSLDRLEKDVGVSTQVDTALRILLREMESTPLGSNSGFDSTNAAYTALRARQAVGDIAILSERLYRRGKATTKLLEKFSDSLAGLRGRKAIVYLSDGISLRPSDPLTMAWLNKFQRWAFNRGLHDLIQEADRLNTSNFDLTSDFTHLAEHASGNKVAFYPIVARNSGIVGSHISAEYSGASVGEDGLGVRSPDVTATDNMLRQSSVLQLAHDTGGIALIDSTDIGSLFDRIKHDFTTFYSLGYMPEATNKSGKERFRKLEVKVKDRRTPGRKLKTRHVRGYRQKDPLERLQQLTLAASFYGTTDNKLQAKLDPGTHLPGAKRGQYRVPVMVKIPFSNLLLLPDERYFAGRVTLYVIVRERGGGISPMRRIELPIQVPADQVASALAREAAYTLQLEIGAGPRRITVGMRDHLARVDSTVNLEIDVGSQPVKSAAAGGP